MNKICLVNSNISQKGSDGDIQIVNFQRGFLILAAVLEKNGYAVEIVDLAWLFKQGELDVNTAFRRKAAELIIKLDINILGFNTRCDTYPNVLSIAKRCKELNPDSIIIFGGPQATFADEETLKEFNYVDIIVRGEGEQTLLEVMEALSRDKNLANIPGITYRQGGCIIRNGDRGPVENLDALPLPAYHLLKKYIQNDDRQLLKYASAYLETGRGCPYRCTFCASTLMNCNRNRLRSPKNIIEEIMLLSKEYNIRYFILGHDHFLANKKLVKEICRFILSRKIDIKWSCSSRIDAINVKDKSLLEMMSRSGCVGIFFGVESGSVRIQRLIKKNINPSLVCEAIRECQRHGISASVAFIMGFPEETREDINATLELALKCRQIKRCQPHIRLLAPMAGTEIFAKNKEKLVFTNFRSDMCRGPLIELKSNMDLVKKHPLLFSVFYTIKPRYVPIELPYKAITVFVKLLYAYPMSSYMAMKELKIEPLELLEELEKWERKCPQAKRLSCNNESDIFSPLKNVKYFPLFLKDLYKKNKLPFTFLRYILVPEQKKCKTFAQQGALLMKYVREKDMRKSRALLMQIYEKMHFVFDASAKI